MRRGAWGLLILGTVGCGSTTEPGFGGTRFDTPIVGVPLASLFYGAYVDEHSRDYACGTKYYAGHQGTDILLRNFRTQDSGVTVVAAAAGTVAATRDGQFDRNTSRGSRLWNFVSILHSDGVTTFYGHLRAGSLRVHPGQTVQSGDPLGLVGSSGDSNWPHLHFEVRLQDSVIDPWKGECQTSPSRWRHQLGYQSQFRVMDTGILDREDAGIADLLERPPDAEPVTGGTGIVTAWAELYNVNVATLRIELRGPTGLLVTAVEDSPVVTYSTAYVVMNFPVAPALPGGPYNAVFLTRLTDGSAFGEIARKSFTLVASPASASLRAGAGRLPSIKLLGPSGDGPGRGASGKMAIPSWAPYRP